jgi:hypothetical protein
MLGRHCAPSIRVSQAASVGMQRKMMGISSVMNSNGIAAMNKIAPILQAPLLLNRRNMKPSDILIKACPKAHGRSFQSLFWSTEADSP